MGGQRCAPLVIKGTQHGQVNAQRLPGQEEPGQHGNENSDRQARGEGIGHPPRLHLVVEEYAPEDDAQE